MQKGRSRASEIAERLTQAIHAHRLVPGVKLSEDEVSGIFDVSRTTTRAALQILAHAQLIDLQPNRGAFVASPSVREAREVFEARALVEPRTARSAAARATPADVVRLRRHLDREHAAMHRGEPSEALVLSGGFHVLIAEIADQDTLLAFIRQLVSRSSLVIALYWRRPSAMCESHAHDALAAALQDGDGDQAETLMKSHLVDLLSLLDLQNPHSPRISLREALT